MKIPMRSRSSSSRWRAASCTAWRAAATLNWANRSRRRARLASMYWRGSKSPTSAATCEENPEASKRLIGPTPERLAREGREKEPADNPFGNPGQRRWPAQVVANADASPAGVGFEEPLHGHAARRSPGVCEEDAPLRRPDFLDGAPAR